ncbi:MAG: ATP phosphoribosyltransferase [Saprospiraceae bacterium]
MSRIKIAIQKKGRLSEKSRALLKECGIKIKTGKANSLISSATNFPVDILYLRDDDIPQYVEDGTADVGILGENVVYETGCEVNTLRKLGFAGCRLSLAVPKGVDYQGVQFFQGKKIATSYPKLTGDYLRKNGVTAELHKISGSVEIAPNIGLADGISDLVSSGSTLFSNGLKEVDRILVSEAIMIANKNLTAEKQAILDKILFRLAAVQKAENNKYIVLNVPNNKIETVSAALPGMKAPTIVPLATKGWSALHSVVSEDQFWEVIDDLKARGAEGILVVPIEKMIV